MREGQLICSSSLCPHFHYCSFLSYFFSSSSHACDFINCCARGCSLERAFASASRILCSTRIGSRHRRRYASRSGRDSLLGEEHVQFDVCCHTTASAPGGDAARDSSSVVSTCGGVKTHTAPPPHSAHKGCFLMDILLDSFATPA